MEDMARCELLRKISEYQFVAVELHLYLNTHPTDCDAKSDYLYYSQQLKELIKTYEAQYGPLMNFGHSPTEVGSYVCSEWPWD